MSLPQVLLTQGHVNWIEPPTPADGSAIAPTGFIVGLRSLTAAGSVVGTYPIQSPVVPATATTDALNAISANLKADDYAASVQAQSGNGPSKWAAEFQFTGILPVPLAPTQVTVA